MKSIKCQSCGLTNWSTVDDCKRCGAPLMSREMPFDNRFDANPYQPSAAPQQFANPHPTMPVRSERMLPMGVLLIILGGIMTAFHLGASLRGANMPMYFLVMGLSLMSSGVFFCMKQWAGVYVYLAGYGMALLTMLITEENTRQLTPRLGGPVILGLFLINKMLKAKKAPDAEYAGQG